MERGEDWDIWVERRDGGEKWVISRRWGDKSGEVEMRVEREIFERRGGLMDIELNRQIKG